jgi:hypothetical protein
MYRIQTFKEQQEELQKQHQRMQKEETVSIKEEEEIERMQNLGLSVQGSWLVYSRRYMPGTGTAWPEAWTVTGLCSDTIAPTTLSPTNTKAG